ncbi:hypothetical protein T265_14072, partial [Opisthorchis viverrini]
MMFFHHLNILQVRDGDAWKSLYLSRTSRKSPDAVLHSNKLICLYGNKLPVSSAGVSVNDDDDFRVAVSLVVQISTRSPFVVSLFAECITLLAITRTTSDLSANQVSSNVVMRKSELEMMRDGNVNAKRIR